MRKKLWVSGAKSASFALLQDASPRTEGALPFGLNVLSFANISMDSLLGFSEGDLEEIFTILVNEGSDVTWER